jgi:hypothetical protein
MDKETTHLMATTISPKLSIGLSYNTTDYTKYVPWTIGVGSGTSPYAYPSVPFPFPPSVPTSGSITIPVTYTYTLGDPERITGEELKRWCEDFVADKLELDA